MRFLRDRYFAGDGEWTIEQGSILDGEYVRGLGTFDVVYAWGVLHHTGAMHDALGAAARLVASGGVFAFALYHRTLMCRLWGLEKRWYAAASPEAQKRPAPSMSHFCDCLLPDGSRLSVLCQLLSRRPWNGLHA